MENKTIIKETIIKVIDYSKEIKKATILDTINIEFTSGKIYGLKGKNGSGKTMLMRAICGLILPTSGYITINDKTIGKDISFPPSIGVLLENPSFINGYTGFRNLKIIATIKNLIEDDQIKKTLNNVGLNCHDKRTYRKYSLGMKQRLGIAAAIMEEPDIVILDEPINALDESGAEMVRNILKDLKEKGAIIILACHDSEELNYLSDEIYTISDGKITNHEICN